MERTILTRRTVITVLGAAGVSLLVPTGSLAAEPLALVVAPKSRISNLSRDKLRRIFRARPTESDDGVAFVPVNERLDGPSRTMFDRLVLGMSPQESKRYWIDQKIRGVPSPRIVSLDALATLLPALAGGIGYLPVTQAGDLKVVRIDGHLPGDAGYFLG
jgi:hypothetical protein